MISVQARISDGFYPQTLEVQQTVLVVTEAEGLSVECPNLVVANEPYECLLSGFTGPNDVFKYTLNGNVIDTPLLPSEFTFLVVCRLWRNKSDNWRRHLYIYSYLYIKFATLLLAAANNAMIR